MDWILWLYLCLLSVVSLALLYSGSQKSWLLVRPQCLHILLGQCLFWIVAQIHPSHYARWTPYLYGTTIILLISVLVIGTTSKGAQRWLNLGLLRFQPSELLKITLPMMLAWYFQTCRLPPKGREIGIAALIIALPMVLIIKQPDLGTAMMMLLSGGLILILAGLSWRFIVHSLIGLALSLPLLWHLLHPYQRERVLTFFNPHRDPLGQGYHLIQSKIAIGSGGLVGKGWLKATQAERYFLPEHSTDFIFSVWSEQFGWVGGFLLLMLCLAITLRLLSFSSKMPQTFARLLTAGLSFVFFLAVLINVAMVSGLLPIVGMPLPLISYGGSAFLTYMIGFGIIVAMVSPKP